VSDKQLDALDDMVDVLDRVHDGLEPLLATCAATKYVAQLVAVPSLGERHKFRKPPRDTRREEEEAERLRREQERLRQQQVRVHRFLFGLVCCKV
jgi:hypothetical protein